MMSDIVVRPAFTVMGIAVETSNQNMQAMQDIGMLWQRFIAEDIFNQIPQKLSQDVYEVFTNYQGNYQAPYRTIIGCMVDPAAVLPTGMVIAHIPNQTYRVYLAKGKLSEAVGQTWGQIWQQDAQLNRAYQADFDVYGARAHDPNNAEVDIFVGVK